MKIFIIISSILGFFILPNKEGINLTINRNLNQNIELPIGDKLISESKFISSINKSCITTNTKDTCVIDKMKFDYYQYNNWKINQTATYKNKNIELIIKKVKPKKSDADISQELKLFIKVNNKLNDGLILYKEKNYAEAMVSELQYFYISKDLYIFTLSVGVDEEGTKVKKWSKYKIDSINGKLVLLMSKTIF